jgi:hypothetical protein
MGKALQWLRSGVVLAFVAALCAGLFLPVYTDEIGWRFQERAGFDGVDKLFAEQCGPNTLARPPFFMWPARLFSSVLNGAFADPLYIRLSGILYALLWAALLLALVRRLGAGAREAAVLACVGFGLVCLGNAPLLLVLSRPEQPVVLAATAALLLALRGWQEDAAETAPGAAWRRSLAIVLLGTVAVSYHLKGLFTVPLLLACIWFAARGRSALAPRLAAGGLLVALTAMAASYWVQRLQCPDDPVLKAAFAANNIGAVLTDLRDWRELFPVIGKVVGNVSIFQYVGAAAPRRLPLSEWLPSGQIGDWASLQWFQFLALAWGLALLAGAASVFVAAREGLRERRLDPRPVFAVVLFGTVIAWSATQVVRNFYEAGFVLPLLALAIVFALSSAQGHLRLGRAQRALAGFLGLCALASPVLIADLWAPSLARSARQAGYIQEQRNSVSVFGYARLEPQILETARLCGIPRPDRAKALMIDDLTYFAMMQSHLPQHRLGVTGLWRGSVRDPVAYLQGRGSDGAVVGCHVLPENLRARARRNGAFCCLAPPNW